jgi:hypothetical protein
MTTSDVAPVPPLNLHEYEAAARAILAPMAFDFVAGGSGDEGIHLSPRCVRARRMSAPPAVPPRSEVIPTTQEARHRFRPGVTSVSTLTAPSAATGSPTRAALRCRSAERRVGEAQRHHRFVGGMALEEPLNVLSVLTYVRQRLCTEHGNDSSPVLP